MGATGKLALAWLAVGLLAAGRGAFARPANTVGIAAVVSAASMNAGPLVAGSIYSIFGAEMSQEEPASAPGVPLPTRLGGARVIIAANGIERDCPLFYVAENQINFQAPVDLPPGAASLRVVAGSSSSAVFPVEVAAAAPETFVIDWSTKNAAAVFAYGERLGLQVTKDERAGEGDYIALYATGLGTVDPPFPASGAPPAELSTTLSPVTVCIGGVTVDALFAGLAPQFVGLYQINFQVPTGLSGAQDVIIQIAGKTSAATTLFISGPDPESPVPYSFADLAAGNLSGKIMHCSGPLFDPSHHDAYLAAFPETKPVMVRTDLNIGETRYTIDKMIAEVGDAFARYPKELPLLTILYISSDHGAVRGLDQEVSEGLYDEELGKLAAFVKGFTKPVFVRPAPEFNGSWSGYHKEYFAASFRHVVTLFRQAGVENAIYLWNYMPQATPFPYLEWYPGDDVVDWWSVDIFSLHFQRPAAGAELAQFLADAAARGKPVMIPESGPSTQGVEDIGVWDTWFVPYFALINGDPNIKGFCYSNEDFTKTTTNPDWVSVMLQNSPIAPLYAEELKKPQYLHQR